MTHLRQVMLEELQRRNFAATTITTYLKAVEQFARYFKCRPDRLNHTHLRTYQVYLLRERKLMPHTVLSFANIASGQEIVDVRAAADQTGAMRETLWTVAALRSALSARRDLFFENLALRHQLGVLAPSDRRFRSRDRLLWVCLRRVWPRWRDALELVKPATVARWHRERFRGCWSRRSRRPPGRPLIDTDVRALIRRMATENSLWGAPRIHGELLKLGVTVSERTVSRYLPDRLTAPSQTWRTFFANHIGLAFTPTVTSSRASRDDDVVEASLLAFRRVPPSRDVRYASNQWAFVDWPPSRQQPPLGWRVAQNEYRRPRRPFSSGKDPPKSSAVELGSGRTDAASFWGLHVPERSERVRF